MANQMHPRLSVSFAFCVLYFVSRLNITDWKCTSFGCFRNYLKGPPVTNDSVNLEYFVFWLNKHLVNFFCNKFGIFSAVC